MSELRRCWCLFVIASLSLAAGARAQSIDAASPGYALTQGTQAYAAGHHEQAIALLADAIRSDPHDPRPYYLRALCLARSGRPVEARADLVVAAALEARQPDRYPVADLLSHLAVADRTLLGEFRWHAQTEDFARAFDEGQISFAERPLPTVRTDAGVLRQKASLPLDRLTGDVTLAELSGIATQRPATLAVETGSNPFSDDPAPAAAPTSQPAEAQNADPFAEELPAADTPSVAAPPAEPADPFAETEPATSGKISSGKLMGILGRAVGRVAPVPSLDTVRDQIRKLPLPATGSQPADGADTFGAGVEPAAFGEEVPAATDAPEAGEAQPPSGSDQQPPADEAQPAAAPEEDPFG
ncbi:MAG: tetratricopeptide repeat protein [Pirellulales bacterium]